MVFQLTSWPLILDDLQKWNQGNWVFNRLYLLNRACHDQSLYETHIVSHIYGISVDLITFDLWWPLKIKSNIIEFLMGFIFWMGHVMTKFCMKTYRGSHMYMYVYGFSVDLMIFELNDLWPGMTFNGKLGTMEVILSNIWINFTFSKLFTWTGTNNDNIMTCYRLHKRFWAMFELTLTWHNFSFGKLLTELAHIMTTYDFLWAKQAILSNVWNQLQLDPISPLVNFSHALAYIMTTYDFLFAKQTILSNVWTDFNLTQFCFWSIFDMNWAHIVITYNFLWAKQCLNRL